MIEGVVLVLKVVSVIAGILGLAAFFGIIGVAVFDIIHGEER